MIVDRPLVGISFIIGFCVVAPLNDSFAKILGNTIPLVQLLTVRMGLQFVILMPIILATGRSLMMTKRVFRLTMLRTALHVAGIGMMFTALRYLPLADAVAITFVMPFILLILGRFVLGEEVGPRRLAACAAGFIGTLLVVQPSFVNVGWPAFLPLAVALIFAFYMLISRQIAKDADPLTLQAVGGLMATPVLGLILWLGLDSDNEILGFKNPDMREIVLLFAVGTFGTFAHLMMAWALRYAPSATLAPIQYLEIPFATLIGWLMFRDLPNGLAAFGIVITVASGLYIIYRERITAMRKPVEV